MSFLNSMFARKKDSVFTTTNELEEALKLPVLSEIPPIKTKKGDERAHLLIDSQSQVRESYRELSKRILKEKKLTSFMITGSTANEDKDRVVADLAITLADAGKKVIVIDFDLLYPGLHLRFGVDNKVGIADVVSGKAKIADVLISTSAKNVSLIPSGDVKKAASLLVSPEIVKIIVSLGFSADIILVNVPPATEKFNAAGIVSKIKGILFVHKLNHTDKKIAQDSCDLLKKMKANIFGIVNIGGGKTMAKKPDKKTIVATAPKKGDTTSSTISETKAYIVILVIGILIISVLGVGAWYLIIQRFSSTPDELVAQSMQQTDTTQETEKTGSSVFGFSSSDEKEEIPPTTTDSGPFGSEIKSDEQPPQVEKEEAPGSDLGQEVEKVVKAPGSSKRPPPIAAKTETPIEDTKSKEPIKTEPELNDRKPETIAKVEPADEKKQPPAPPVKTRPAQIEQPKSTPPAVTKAKVEKSIPKTTKMTFPKIGKMPHSVLVHSFSDKEGDSALLRARRATTKLNDLGYGAYWTKARVSGRLWYRVLVGVFPNSAEASAMAKKMSGEFKVEASVLNLPYAVELGWQPSVEEANAVATQVARFQYSTYRTIMLKGGIKWVLLRTGAFSTQEEAEELLKYLKSDGFRGQVVKR